MKFYGWMNLFYITPKKGEDWMKKKIERIIDCMIFLL